MLDGLEDNWTRRWQQEGTYAFDRSKGHAEACAIDTPRLRYPARREVPPPGKAGRWLRIAGAVSHTDSVADQRHSGSRKVNALHARVHESPQGVITIP